MLCSFGNPEHPPDQSVRSLPSSSAHLHLQNRKPGDGNTCENLDINYKSIILTLLSSVSDTCKSVPFSSVQVNETSNYNTPVLSLRGGELGGGWRGNGGGGEGGGDAGMEWSDALPNKDPHVPSTFQWPGLRWDRIPSRRQHKSTTHRLRQLRHFLELKLQQISLVSELWQILRERNMAGTSDPTSFPGSFISRRSDPKISRDNTTHSRARWKVCSRETRYSYQ